MSSYLVLARRWRPRSFDALIGQTHATRALRNALGSGRVSHAFLLTGIRGVGKTTLARLLAMCLNCETGVTPDPCGECGACREVIAGNHPDVFEIDAASRTKVEQMRELLDLVGFAPTSARYKVFILDEIHMLSTPSFNALLKTLEEPPAHVKFIFATTESRKIPATILSRCQRYDLKRVVPEVLTSHLTHILNKESFPFDAPGLAAVVRAAQGSVRDALSLLEQVIAHGDGAVRFEAVRDLLGMTDQDGVLTLLDHLLNGRGAEILEVTARFYQDGVDAEVLVNALLDRVHEATRQRVAGKGKEPPSPEAQRLYAITAPRSMEHLQMIYQVLFRGLQDLRQADDALPVLEMLLLRIAFLKPVPDLEKLLAQPPPGNRSAPVRSAPNRPAPNRPAPDRSAPNRPAPVVAEQHLTEKPPFFSPPRVREKLTSWQQLLSSATERDPGLAMKLEQQVALVAFQPGHDDKPPEMTVRLKNDIFGPPQRVRQQLSAFLDTRGLELPRIVVEPASETPCPETDREKRDRKQKAHREQVRAEVEKHPVVRELAARFQAEVLHIAEASPPDV